MKKRSILVVNTIVAIVIGFLFTVQTEAVNTDPAIKADNYQITARLDPKRDRLQETVTMQVTNNSQQTVKRLLIRNMANSVLRYDRHHFYRSNRGRYSIVKKISSNKQNLNYQLGKDHSYVFVNLSQGLAPGQTRKLTVNVTTDIPHRRDRFGVIRVHGGKVYNLSFCFPYLSDYRRGHWDSHPYSDMGENRNNAVSNYQVVFYAPRAYRIAAPGSKTSKNGKTTINARQLRDLAVVASNRFKVSYAKADGIELKNFYLASKSRKLTNVYRQLTTECAADSLRLYSQKIGRYPYHQLVLTESPLSANTGGMEYSGLVMISDEGFLGRYADTMNSYELLQDVSHEVAHQWFFSTVGSDEYEEPWLDEGMADFLENFCYSTTKTKSYLEMLRMTGIHSRNDKGLWRMLNALARENIRYDLKRKGRTIINYPLYKMNSDQYVNTVYEQGQYFYADLRAFMGQKRFYQMLQNYYQTYYLKQATGRDFLSIVQKYDHRPKVERLIHRYINPQYLR